MRDTERLKGALRRWIKGLLRGTDYHALYEARVVSQTGQLLELRPVTETMPPVRDVPMRLGLPGCTVQVAAGSTVLLGFENGDPGRPVATLWGGSTITDLTIGGSAVAVGRVGDAVGPTSAMTSWMSSVSSHVGISNPASLATITAGSPRVKA